MFGFEPARSSIRSLCSSCSTSPTSSAIEREGVAIRFMSRSAYGLSEPSGRGSTVVAPVETDGMVQFEPWTAGQDVELDVLLAKQSPKEGVPADRDIPQVRVQYDHAGGRCRK